MGFLFFILLYWIRKMFLKMHHQPRLDADEMILSDVNYSKRNPVKYVFINITFNQLCAVS